MKRFNKIKRQLAGIVLLFLCACQNSSPTTQIFTPSVAPSLPAMTNANPDDNGARQRLLEIQSAWQNGAHGDKTQISSSSGTMVSLIDCKNCHLNEDGETVATIAWLNVEEQQYELMSDNSTLCLKCHNDILSTNTQPTADLTIHHELQCTDCHEPHSALATCSNSSCHINIVMTNGLPPSTPTGIHPNTGDPFCGGASCHPAATKAASSPPTVHSYIHENVTCPVCHDAVNISTSLQEVGSLKLPSFSHQIQSKVDCNRCHFEDNPWGLSLVGE